MRRIIIAICCMAFGTATAQEHFAGKSTSRRVGVTNFGINPAELANLDSKYEINVVGLSVSGASNKVGFKDIVAGNDIEDLIFSGTESADFRFDGEIYLPSFAMKYGNWGFALTLKSYAKLNVVNVDPVLGSAIANSNPLNLLFVTNVNRDDNQRLYGTAWGELGLSAAHVFYEDSDHKLSGGASLKLLFPGSYANFGADSFGGTVENTPLDVYLTNTTANLNISYSGSLARDYSDAGNYTRSLFGKLNGLAADFGANYQLKDSDGGYRLSAGLAFRNIGGMTFKSPNNSETSYRLNIPEGERLSLRQFQNAKSFEDVERILLNSGYLDKTQKTSTDFKVKLPAVFSAYANVKIVPKLLVSVYTQQKLNSDDENRQVTTQNIFSITPRFSSGIFEAYLPLAANEISGFTAGVGFRAAGFYIGSGSLLSGVIGNGDQADVYIGYSFGLD